MENEEKDIIRQLADKLREAEVPYKEGAWERFAAREAKLADAGDAFAVAHTGTRVRSLIRPWVAVAAALVLAAGAGWLWLRPTGGQAPGQVASNTPQIQQQLQQNNLATPEHGDKVIDRDKDNGNRLARQPLTQPAGNNALAAASASAPYFQQSAKQPSADRSFSFPYLIQEQGIITVRTTDNLGQTNRAAAARIAQGALAATGNDHAPRTPGLQLSPVGPVLSYNQVATGSTDQAQQMQRQTTASNTDKAIASVRSAEKDRYFDDKGYIDMGAERSTGKWNMGVMVIPAVSNSAKLNMGYGLSVGYNLSSRLSINSGLAYTELSGSKDAGGQTNQPAIASSGRVLSSIDATATGLNVPLELRYHISRKIYVGTGVSAMAVLSDKVERKYAIAQMQTSAFESRYGQPLKPDQMQSIASNIQTKEPVPADQTGSRDFAGFVNFSFGFKQPLNKSKSLSIEPFISIPMSNHLFNQNIRMTDGGLRIKLGL